MPEALRSLMKSAWSCYSKSAHSTSRNRKNRSDKQEARQYQPSSWGLHTGWQWGWCSCYLQPWARRWRCTHRVLRLHTVGALFVSLSPFHPFLILQWGSAAPQDSEMLHSRSVWWGYTGKWKPHTEYFSPNLPSSEEQQSLKKQRGERDEAVIEGMEEVPSFKMRERHCTHT